MKENFLEIIKGTSPEQLREYIKKNGKDPKLVKPIIMIDTEDRFILKKGDTNVNNN